MHMYTYIHVYRHNRDIGPGVRVFANGDLGSIPGRVYQRL